MSNSPEDMARQTSPYTKITINPATVGFVLLFCLIPLQNVSAIVLSGFNHEIAKAVVAIKDVYLYLIMLCLSGVILIRLCRLRIRCSDPEDVLMLLATVYFTVGYIISPYGNILSFRQLMIIPLFYGFGRFYVKHAELESVKKAIVLIMLVVCVSGYIERFLLFDETESFWNLMGIREYMKMKGMEQWAFGQGGTPGSFYTVDLHGFGDIDHLRRMSSVLFAEPTLFGQFLVMPTIYFIFKRKWLLALFYLSAILAAISKGGLLGVFVAMTLYYLQNNRNPFMKTAIVATTLFLSAGFAYLAYFTSSFASVAVHLVGLISNIQGLIQSPMGKGVGAIGNMAVLASFASGGSLDEDASGESFLGTLIGQLGIPGLLFYALFFYYIWKKKVGRDEPFLMAVKYSALATLIAGIGSESAISYVGTGYLFALLPFVAQCQKDTEMA